MAIRLVGLNEAPLDNYKLPDKHKILRAIGISGTVDSITQSLSYELHSFNDYYSDSFMHPRLTRVIFIASLSLYRIQYLVNELINNQTSAIERLKVPHLFKYSIHIARTEHGLKVPQILHRYIDKRSTYYSFLIPTCETRTLGKWRQHSNCFFTLEMNKNDFNKIDSDLERKYILTRNDNTVLLTVADGDLSILKEKHKRLMKDVIDRESKIEWAYFKARHVE